MRALLAVGWLLAGSAAHRTPLPSRPASTTAAGRSMRTDDENYMARKQRYAPSPRIAQVVEQIDDEDFMERLREMDGRLQEGALSARSRPLSRRMVGASAIAQVQRAADAAATEYLDLVPNLAAARRFAQARGSAPLESPSQTSSPEPIDAVLRMTAHRHFGVDALLGRIAELVDEESAGMAEEAWAEGGERCGDEGVTVHADAPTGKPTIGKPTAGEAAAALAAQEAELAAMAASHVPTAWSCFRSAVRRELKRRDAVPRGPLGRILAQQQQQASRQQARVAQASPAGFERPSESWAASVEWRLLQQLYLMHLHARASSLEARQGSAEGASAESEVLTEEPNHMGDAARRGA